VPASATAKNAAPRKSGVPHKPRPASEPAPTAALPSRDDSIQPTSPRQPVSGGIDE
jgi:penicillin-binding protein 2